MKPLAQNTLIQNRYLIVHLIGKGGMGEVYLAVDQRLGSAVALKRTFFAGDEMLGNAFEREARTLARMRHPVLPKVSDHFGEGDEQYLVMEHISGDDLAKRLELAQKPFPVSWVLFWADQLLDALSYLHTHEPPIIHRDIKPQNLKLTDENHIILLDFGLSKTSTGMTNVSQSGSTGSVVGYTPHYAPMEQIRGIGTSPKSDLYSLSATLYQLMTNKIPADALSRADSMLNGMADPITPPSGLNPEIPKAVSDVILKGMEVSQERRYSDAREMQKVLRKAFNEMQQTSTASTVAFNAFDQRSLAIEPPPAPDQRSGLHQGGAHQASVGSPLNVVDNQEVQNAAAVDLNATMVSEEPSISASHRQADVRTEVFLSGGNSLPLPEKQSYESAPAVNEVPSAPPADHFAAGHTGAQVSGSAGFSPDATMAYLSDPGLHAGASDTSTENQTDFYGSGAESRETFSDAGSSYYDSQQQEAEEQTQAPYKNLAPAEPVKKSTKRTWAFAGGFAALFLLTAVTGAGIWAYLNFAPGMTETDPISSPSPEPSFEPSPEPTLESVFDTNSSQVDEPDNTNTNSTANDEILTVSPTPESTPAEETPPPAGATPRNVPRETPARTTGTPRERPTPRTRKTPVVTPTVLQ